MFHAVVTSETEAKNITSDKWIEITSLDGRVKEVAIPKKHIFHFKPRALHFGRYF